MDLRSPVNNMSLALLHAMEVGLTGVASTLATDLLGPVDGQPRRRRPHALECHTVMFQQAMRKEDVAFSDARGPSTVEGDLIIVLGPEGDACVYFAVQFLYHVQRPNRRFFLDTAAQSMLGTPQCSSYEGLDSAETESIDCSFEMELSRLLAAMSHTAGRNPRAVAQLLRSYAARFDAILPDASLM